MSRTIKMQEEQFPINSLSYDHAFFNHCLTSFYDQDSSDNIIQAKCTTQEVLFYLQNNIDLCDTPLNQIMKIVKNTFAFKDIDLDLLNKKILKQKNIIKRNRAKLRKNNKISQRDYTEIVLINEEGDQWSKKQRNRISAQISRDKKKQRVKQLEQMNQKLQEQCILQKIQNIKLKESIQLDNKKRQISNDLSQKSSSKISKMLIFLGIICLFGIIKDIFLSKDNSSDAQISKITPSLEKSTVKKDLAYLNHSQDKGKMLQIIQAPLLQMFEDQSLAGKLKNKLQAKFDDWPIVSSLIPSKLKKYIQEIKLQSL